MKLIRFLPVCIISSAFLSMNTYVQESDSTYTLTNNEIESVISINGIESLVNLSDPFKADIIGDRTWGRTRCMYRVAQGDWLSVNPYAKRIEAEGDTVVRIIDCQPGMPVCMEQKISLKKNGLDLDISIETKMQFPVTIGDLAISFPWRTARGEEPSYIFEQCFTKHHFIAGDGSFLYFTRWFGEVQKGAVI